MKKINLILIAFVLLLLVPVYAQSILAPLEIFQGIDLGSFYAQNNLWVDGVIYFIIFIGMASITIGKKFEGSGGKAVTVGIGLALSFAMIYYSNLVGFNLGQLGPWVLVLFMILIAYAIFSAIRYMGEDSSLIAVAIAYVVVWLMLSSILKNKLTGDVGEYIINLSGWGWLIFFVCLIYLIYHFGKMIFGRLRNRSSDDSPNPPRGQVSPPQDPQSPIPPQYPPQVPPGQSPQPPGQQLPPGVVQVPPSSGQDPSQTPGGQVPPQSPRKQAQKQNNFEIAEQFIMNLFRFIENIKKPNDFYSPDFAQFGGEMNSLLKLVESIEETEQNGSELRVVYSQFMNNYNQLMELKQSVEGIGQGMQDIPALVNKEEAIINRLTDDLNDIKTALTRLLETIKNQPQ